MIRRRKDQDPRFVRSFTLDDPCLAAVEAYKSANDIEATHLAIKGIIIEWFAADPITGATTSASHRAYNETRNYLMQRLTEFLKETIAEINRAAESRPEVVE